MSKFLLKMILYVLIESSVCFFVLSAHSICYAEVSLFGIKLGEVNILRECKIDPVFEEYKSTFKSYDSADSDCYKTRDFNNDCDTDMRIDVSFATHLQIEFEEPCDRNSKVIKIVCYIGPESFDQVLSLMINKFGKPKKTENSTVQNRMGASFKQTEVYWSVENCELYLSRYAGSLKGGVLAAMHPIYLNKTTDEYQKKANQDANKF